MGNIFDNCPDYNLFICIWKKSFYVAADHKLVSLGINTGAITVSGVGSGATFAHQYHLAYAEAVRGCGLIGGLPYMADSFDTDTYLISAEGLAAYEKNKLTGYQYYGEVEDPAYLFGSSVYILSPLNQTVNEPVYQ